MKRRDAFRKLRTICQRLDEVDPQQFFVIPLRLYLFGSLLTDKPNPGDIDRNCENWDTGGIANQGQTWYAERRSLVRAFRVISRHP
jgi:hypothetical protein